MPLADRPMGFRLPDPGAAARPANGEAIDVLIGADDEAPEVMKAAGGAEITVDSDGSVVVDPSPAEPAPSNRDEGFDANLADDLDDLALGEIAAELIEGINADEQSRQEWVENYNSGMDLLGLKREKPSKDNGTMSTVRHPVLLESTVRFQAAARAELLPANGPCKVRNDGDDSTDRVALAEALEKDMNHYLTVTATEYVPDTDRGLFYLGYGGCIFKKVYSCPLRKRPVSECVYLPDLVVSNEATDLDNAIRVTHVIPMTKSTFRRMQLAGAYRDIPLSVPAATPRPTKQKEGQIAGVNPQPQRQDDQPYMIHECYTELDLGRWGKAEKGAPKDLPLPYRITLEKETQKILEIRRNWKQGDPDYRKRRVFVKFPLVPGFGFYDLGYLHLLGNQAVALTAIWRILCDAGMFNSFPGGVRVKGLRNSTNEIKPAPGEFVEVDIGKTTSIQDAVMPFPYKEPSQVLMAMGQEIEQNAQRLGHAVELEVGEGRTNVPVGTIMSMIEQQTMVMAAVHKRLHGSQATELQLLRDLFAEDPEALWRGNKRAQRQWRDPAEFEDLDLVPASDPNVPGQIHRIMQATALSILAAQNPDIYKRIAVQKRLLQTINISNADDLLITEEQQAAQAAAQAQQPPDPRLGIAAAQQATKQQDLQLKAEGQAQKIAADQAEGERKEREMAQEAEERQADRESREKVALIHEETERLKLAEQMERTRTAAAQHAAEQAARHQGLGAPMQ